MPSAIYTQRPATRGGGGDGDTPRRLAVLRSLTDELGDVADVIGSVARYALVESNETPGHPAYFVTTHATPAAAFTAAVADDWAPVLLVDLDTTERLPVARTYGVKYRSNAAAIDVPDAAVAAYQDRLRNRRALGDSRHGDRHLHPRGGQSVLADAVQDLATAAAHLLALHAGAPGNVCSAAQWRACRAGRAAARAARDISDPRCDFERAHAAATQAVRPACAASHASDALTAIADARVRVSLTAEWLRHHDNYPPAIQSRLVALADEIDAAAAAADTIPDASATPRVPKP